METKTITRLGEISLGDVISNPNSIKIGDYVSFLLDESVGIITGIRNDYIVVVVIYSNSNTLDNGHYIKGNITWFRHVEEVLLRTEKVKTNGK